MRHTVRPSFRDIVHGYLVLPHAVPIIVVMSATAAFALVAARGWPGAGPMGWLLLAMFGGQLAVGAINEIVDAPLDAQSRPSKPIPAGLVTLRGAWLMAIIGLVVMTVASLTFGIPVFLVCAFGTGVGIAYSVWFKRTIWSWVPYLVALPLLPIWVWLALSTVDPGLYAIYPIGAAAVIAVQIAQSLPDVEADTRAHVRTLAVALGARWALLACWGALALAAVLAAVLAPWLTDSAHWVWIMAVIAGVLIAVNAAIWSRDRRRGVLASFPCVSVGAVALGIGWALALIGA
jgi:4-hydroxybenzoate polyprenyltransferase